MDKGITNLEINKYFENEENQDIKIIIREYTKWIQ